MADFYGADTEQLREQAGACLRGSGTLRDLIGSTSALVGSVEWTGPDADAFRERWQSVVRAQLTERADALRARADDLQAQAEEQDGASDGDGGSGGGPFGFPMPFPFPLPLPLPLPFPVPGQTPPWENPGPFDRSNLPKGPQEFYGDPGYGTGNAAGNERPVGSHDAGGSHWDGKEIENDRGYFDGYANTRASAGTNTTVDGYGNTTHTAGARAGAEIGYDEKLNLPFGSSLTSQGRAGAEAYGEAGVTYGPDGVSAGAGAGAGVYGDITDTLNLPFGASEAVGIRRCGGACQRVLARHAQRGRRCQRLDPGRGRRGIRRREGRHQRLGDVPRGMGLGLGIVRRRSRSVDRRRCGSRGLDRSGRVQRRR